MTKQSLWARGNALLYVAVMVLEGKAFHRRLRGLLRREYTASTDTTISILLASIITEKLSKAGFGDPFIDACMGDFFYYDPHPKGGILLPAFRL